MREYGWKIALVAIALCYPAANAASHVVMWILIVINPADTGADRVAALRMGNLLFVGVGMLMWMVAILAGANALQVDGDAERRVGRVTFGIVVVATVAFAAVFFSQQALVNLGVG